jgi:cytidylate kinase
MGEVARHPAVILAAAAASTLADHPGAVHVRLWAPKEWRAAAYSRTEMVDREKAAHEVARADHVERAWVHALFDVRVDDPTLYTICLDASRLGVDRIVGVLSAAGDAS